MNNESKLEWLDVFNRSKNGRVVESVKLVQVQLSHIPPPAKGHQMKARVTFIKAVVELVKAPPTLFLHPLNQKKAVRMG